MSTDVTTAHYETLLAPIYRWMLGDLSLAVERSRLELTELGLLPAREGARGLDLGAGLGLQTIPLAEGGYSMTAVDTSRELLAELAASCPRAAIVVGDVCDIATLVSGKFDTIVCMGDTLTHLPSVVDVERLVGAACERLQPGGTLALTFRDYASVARASTDRFILVRADAERILTCCLDYGIDRVSVTDIVHQKSAEGWRLTASEYPKLRLSRELVTALIQNNGAQILRSDSRAGRIAIVARRAVESRS
jgi:2-polyprenyl-3-methyl-5-hydroxy-6-metoxy-1,4-benzoquinol methylase